MSIPDRVVFDAEPLIAHADDEAGSDVVEEFLDPVAIDTIAGYASSVTLAEIRYTIARKYDRTTADEYLAWLDDLGVETVDGSEAWLTASEYVLEYSPSLGDSFALATADHVDATLLVGGDCDYDEITEVPIERFRDGPA